MDPSEHEQLRALVNRSVSDVVFRIGVEDDRFRVLEINPAFTRATGLEAALVVGKLVEEVIPEPSLSLVLGKYREAIAERRTVRWDEVTEYPTGRKYGEVSVTPVVDARGRCTGLLGTVHDVTDLRIARELRDAERRVLEMVAAGNSLTGTLTALVEMIEALAPPAIASVLLLSEDGTRLRPGAAPHLPDAFNRAIDDAPIGPTAGSCGSAAALRRPVIVTDIELDPLWDDYRELARSAGVRACWSTPITARNHRVLGTFAIYYREPRAPQPSELELIERVTHVAGIVIQRHELDEQLRRLTARIEAAREEERTGIAREIHDQLGQSLTVMKMDLAWIHRRAASPDGLAKEALLEKLDDLLVLSDEIIEAIRRISAELRPGILDDIGLDAAIAWEAQQFERRSHVPTVVRSGLSDEERLPREIETAAFRVLQEALTNVVRHAEATRVDILVEEATDGLILQVRDDGRGITRDQIEDPRSIGLVGMRERARRLGGIATFEPANPGTLVTLRLPLPR